MNVDFEYLNTFPDGHKERSAQKKFSSMGGCQKPVSSVKVPIEHIEITLRNDKETYKARGFEFVEFFPTDDGEMYYPGWESSVKLLTKLKNRAKEIEDQGDFTDISLIGNGGCTNYWTTRGLALYLFSSKNVPRIKDPKKIDIKIVRVIEKTTPPGFNFKEYLPNIPYSLILANGDETKRNLNFHQGEVKKLKTELPGYYVVSRNLYIRENLKEKNYVHYEDVGYAVYTAKKPKPLI